jgi:hypothetical protein
MASKSDHRSMTPTRPYTMPVNFIIILILFVSILTACQSTDTSPTATRSSTELEPSSQVTQGAPPETEAPEGPDAIQVAWQGSSHADAYVLTDAGENNACARCHAPVNWIPTMDTIPESCLTCKFEIDPPPPFIPEEEWTNIECKVCHRAKKGKIEEEVAWLEIAPIEEYADVASITELCDKCHLGDGLPDHSQVVVRGAHEGYECIECHDAHDISASCSDTDCHEDVLATSTTIPGHDEDHASVACVACHDAGGMEIGWVEGESIWSTLIVSELEEEFPSKPFASHDIVLAAPCERCHYPGNPFELSESVSTREP